MSFNMQFRFFKAICSYIISILYPYVIKCFVEGTLVLNCWLCFNIALEIIDFVILLYSAELDTYRNR